MLGLGRKNQDDLDFTVLIDLVVTALIMVDEPYELIHLKNKTVIKWRDNIVVVKGKKLWFNNSPQLSVFNVIKHIKALAD